MIFKVKCPECNETTECDIDTGLAQDKDELYESIPCKSCGIFFVVRLVVTFVVSTGTIDFIKEGR